MKTTKILVLALAGAVCLGVGAKTKKKATVPVIKMVQPVPADSFSYAMGVLQSNSLKQFLIQREGVDSTQMGEVARGMSTNMDSVAMAKQIAYAAGLKIREMNVKQVIPSINQQAAGSKGAYMNIDKFTEGLCAVMTGGKATLTQTQAQDIVKRQQDFIAQKSQIENTAWLISKKGEKGVIMTPSGLMYKVITKGTGAAPTDSSEVEVNYEGKLIDGKIFDSSYERKQPATFGVNQVIKGWTEGLKLMNEGSTYELYIPSELAYGEQGNQGIPPYSTLVFKVELLKVKKNPAPAAPAKAAKAPKAAKAKK